MLFMHDLNTVSSYRITLSISIAILFHTLLGIFLFQFLPELEQKKTIPVQLVVSSKATSSAVKTQANAPSNRPTENAEDILNKEHLQNASSEVVTTVSESRSNAVTAKDNNNEKDKLTTPTQSNKTIKQENIFIPQIKTDLPDVRKDLAESSKSQAASKSFADIASLFRQQQEMEASVVQISSDPELPQLSEYERKLFEKLNNSQFHDRMYPIISQLDKSKTITLELFLFSNGSIKNVQVKHSSGHSILDNAARRTALDASPYPEPPATDKATGFRYQVSIRYDPIRTQ